MHLGLKDKRVVVMGASRGLGKAVAREFVREGARVALCARSPEGVEAAVDDLKREGIQALNAAVDILGLPADVTQATDLDRFFEAVNSQFDGVDILITNAGGPRPGRFLDVTPEDWEAALNLTVMSAVRAIYHVVPGMQARHAGSIVLMNSFTVKQPVASLTLSNAIRMALSGLAKTLADELGPSGIRVNSALPGWTATERVDQILHNRARQKNTTPQQELEAITRDIPLGRMGTPDEFARAVVFLASPAASYVDGTALLVDGGIVRSMA